MRILRIEFLQYLCYPILNGRSMQTGTYSDADGLYQMDGHTMALAGERHTDADITGFGEETPRE